MEALFNEIGKRLYRSFSKKQMEDLIKIWKEEKAGGENNTYIATDICDYLSIERRHNRTEIRKVLNEYDEQSKN